MEARKEARKRKKKQLKPWARKLINRVQWAIAGTTIVLGVIVAVEVIGATMAIMM